MSDIYVRAGCFVTIILMGYVLRRVGFFKKEDFIESRVRPLPSDFALHIQGEWIPCGVWEGI